MLTVFLDGNDYASAAEVHEALQRLLNLPDYYGRNADALYDCLSERPEPVNFILKPGKGEAADTLRKVAVAAGNLGGRVTLLGED